MARPKKISLTAIMREYKLRKLGIKVPDFYENLFLSIEEWMSGMVEMKLDAPDVIYYTKQMEDIKKTYPSFPFLSSNKQVVVTSPNYIYVHMRRDKKYLMIRRCEFFLNLEKQISGIKLFNGILAAISSSILKTEIKHIDISYFSHLNCERLYNEKKRIEFIEERTKEYALNIAEFKIGQFVMENGVHKCEITNKTSNSIEILHKAKTAEGVDSKQWYDMKSFTKMFKVITDYENI